MICDRCRHREARYRYDQGASRALTLCWSCLVKVVEGK